MDGMYLVGIPVPPRFGLVSQSIGCQQRIRNFKPFSERCREDIPLAQERALNLKTFTL